MAIQEVWPMWWSSPGQQRRQHIYKTRPSEALGLPSAAQSCRVLSTNDKFRAMMLQWGKSPAMALATDHISPGWHLFIPHEPLFMTISYLPWLLYTTGCVNPSWHHCELYSDSPHTPLPQPPLYRLEGFGKINPNLHVHHSSPLPHFAIHEAWDFLDSHDWSVLARTYPAFRGWYAILHCSTTTMAMHSLQDPCPPPETFQGLQHDRAWCLTMATWSIG
jgi:hypothetical protein